MTCIVGVVSGGEVWVGGDSAGSNSSYIVTRRQPKVFRVGRMLIGTSGALRTSQLLRCSFSPPNHPIGTMSDEHYLAGPFCDAVRKLFTDAGATTTLNKKESADNTYLLVGYRGHLYRMESDYQIGETADGYDAIGSGMYYALGSLHSTKYFDDHGTYCDARERIECALDAASYFCPSVRGPYIIEKL